eukprot:gene13532-23286_t
MSGLAKDLACMCERFDDGSARWLPDVIDDDTNETVMQTCPSCSKSRDSSNFRSSSHTKGWPVNICSTCYMGLERAAIAEALPRPQKKKSGYNTRIVAASLKSATTTDLCIQGEGCNCMKAHPLHRTFCNCVSIHLEAKVDTQIMDTFNAATSFQGRPCTAKGLGRSGLRTKSCPGSYDLTKHKEGTFGNAGWELECDSCKDITWMENQAPLPKPKPTAKPLLAAIPRKEVNTLGIKDRPLVPPDEDELVAWVRLAGRFGAKVLASTMLHSADVRKTALVFSDLGIPMPDAFVNGFFKSHIQWNVALPLADKVLRECQELRGNVPGSLVNAHIGTDTGWHGMTKQGNHGVGYLNNNDERGVWPDGVTMASKTTTPKEEAVGVPKFSGSSQSVEPKCLNANLLHSKVEIGIKDPELCGDDDSKTQNVYTKVFPTSKKKKKSDRNHKTKKLPEIAEEVRKNKAVDLKHGAARALGGCKDLYVNGKRVAKTKDCRGVDKNNLWGQYWMKPSMQCYLKQLVTEYMGKEDLTAAGPPKHEAAFVQAWYDGFDKQTGHIFDKHVVGVCDPALCAYVAGSTKKTTRPNLGVNCEAQVPALKRGILKLYNKDALISLYTDKYSQACEAFMQAVAQDAAKSVFQSAIGYQRKVAVTTARLVEQAVPLIPGKKLLLERAFDGMAAVLGIPAATIAPGTSAVRRARKALEAKKRDAEHKRKPDIMQQNNRTRMNRLREAKVANAVHSDNAYGQGGRKETNVRGQRTGECPETRTTLINHIRKMHETNDAVLPRPGYKLFVVKGLSCATRATPDEVLRTIWHELKMYDSYLLTGGIAGEWTGSYKKRSAVDDGGAPPAKVEKVVGDVSVKSGVQLT